MDISNNKSFLAGALSALSGQIIVPSKDDDAQASAFSMDKLANALGMVTSDIEAAEKDTLSFAST